MGEKHKREDKKVMKCMYCGADLPEGASFCGACGRKVETVMASAPVEQASPYMSPVNTGKPSRGGRLWLVIGIVVAVLLVFLLAGFGIGKLISSSRGGSEKMLVYLKNGSLYYTANMDKEKEPFEIDSSVQGFSDVCISDEGTYLYYISNDSRGTLYRARLGKMKGDVDKNRKYIDEIDSRVEDYRLLEEDTLIYCTTDRRLFYYDGEEETDIDRNVENLGYVADGRLYYTTYNNGEYVYCYYDLDEMTGDSYARNLDIYSVDWENDRFYYMQESAFYEGNRSGDSTKLAENISWVVGADAASEVVYFVRQRTKETSLYDCVLDRTAGEDALLTKPEKKDYLNKVAESKVLTKQDKDYYKEYPQYKDDFYKNRLYEDFELKLKTYYNWEKNQKFYYEDDKWYAFDEEAYNEADEAYRGAEKRIRLRESLKEETYEETTYDLYQVKEGRETLLAENVDNLYADAMVELVTYAQYDGLTFEKRDVSELEGTYEVWQQINEARLSSESGRYCYRLGETEGALESAVTGLQVSPDHQKVMMRAEEILHPGNEDGYEETISALYCYFIKNGQLEQPGKLTRCEEFGYWVEDAYYFASGVTDGYGDFVVYRDGEEETLMKNISVYDIRLYDDGNYTAFKNRGDGDLYLYNSKGEDTRISKNVQRYSYINEERIVYLRDDGLYVYDGSGEDRRIERYLDGTDSFWCMEKSYR